MNVKVVKTPKNGSPSYYSMKQKCPHKAGIFKAKLGFCFLWFLLFFFVCVVAFCHGDVISE